jgi:hypothetical protein
MAVHDRVLRPDSERTTVATTKCTKSGCKLDGGRRMPGAGLSRQSPRKAPLGQSAFQPYWGKLAVRNDRGDRGNVGIIRSPIRASILPDLRHWVRYYAPANAHSFSFESPQGEFARENFEAGKARCRYAVRFTRMPGALRARSPGQSPGWVTRAKTGIQSSHASGLCASPAHRRAGRPSRYRSRLHAPTRTHRARRHSWSCR